MRSPIFAASLLAASVLAVSARAQLLDDGAKQVAAPPSDVLSGRVVLPTAAQTAVESPVRIAALEPRRDADAWIATADVDVDAVGEVVLELLTPRDVDWTWDVVDARGASIDLARASTRERRDLADEAPSWSADRLAFSADRTGTLRVNARARGATPPPNGWLVARTAGDARLVAHASTIETRSDVEIGIVARFDGVEALAGARGRAVVELATGSLALELVDDGRHADGEAGDGTYGALLPRWTSGPVRARVDLAATTRSGAIVARTAQIAFPVIERRAALTGGVEAAVARDGRVRIALDALALGPIAKTHVSAEVWGTSGEGELAPVCWLSRMTTPSERDGSLEFALDLDTGWIDLAGARAPFVLRRVRVQDPDTSIPHDVVDEIAFTMPTLAPTGATTITTSMLQGPIAAQPIGPHAPIGGTTASRALLLVHGYCSGGSIWPAAHYTQPKLEFQDPNANRTHDQFALLLRQATSGLHSFGVVAHSQGGMAALHLYTYYASGLDHAQGARLIQSVGSPYQGTPLASLGFFACGVNDDMTTSGGPLWLAGIPTWARSEVWYWTTQNSGSACSSLANIFLGQPNDGTCERDRGQLPGANSMGHVTGWCHTTGMSNPAQYTDAVRNAERNTQAAR